MLVSLFGRSSWSAPGHARPWHGFADELKEFLSVHEIEE
jgi:hypothetical protein